MQYANHDWESIVTPINVPVLERYLLQYNYERDKRDFLIKGFQQGFDIGYQGPENHQHMSHNLPYRVGSPTDLWNKVMNEVKDGRFAGPFVQLPFQQYVQSPLGLVPKSGGTKMRLIFHLSYDFGPLEKERSIGLTEVSSQRGVFSFRKNDCSNAFRLVLTLVKQRKIFCMMAIHPSTGEKFFL